MMQTRIARGNHTKAAMRTKPAKINAHKLTRAAIWRRVEQLCSASSGRLAKIFFDIFRPKKCPSAEERNCAHASTLRGRVGYKASPAFFLYIQHHLKAPRRPETLLHTHNIPFSRRLLASRFTGAAISCWWPAEARRLRRWWRWRCGFSSVPPSSARARNCRPRARPGRSAAWRGTFAWRTRPASRFRTFTCVPHSFHSCRAHGILPSASLHRRLPSPIFPARRAGGLRV